MTNRNPVKQLFITFPKSNVDKLQFRDTLLRLDPQYYKVVEEKHKDGTPHLHAVIKFKNKYSKSYVLKYFKEIYPDDYKRIDVEAVRSIKKALLYLSKEDQSPLESGEYQESRNPQRNWRDKFARELGYNSAADCVSHYEKRDLKTNIYYTQIWQFFKDQAWQYGCTPEEHVHYVKELYPYEDQKHFDSFLENRFSKDDITFFSKEFKIKVE